MSSDDGEAKSTSAKETENAAGVLPDDGTPKKSTETEHQDEGLMNNMGNNISITGNAVVNGGVDGRYTVNNNVALSADDTETSVTVEKPNASAMETDDNKEDEKEEEAKTTKGAFMECMY
eukprot:scaffold379529_cov162-Cyclotella_meneghiniana.AAC.1